MRKIAIETGNSRRFDDDHYPTTLCDFLILDFRILLQQEAVVWVQPEDYEVVGAVLAAARRKANMTQVQLAALVGKPQSVVSGYEAGKRRLDVVEFVRVVRTLGADPIEVFAEIVNALP